MNSLCCGIFRVCSVAFLAAAFMVLFDLRAQEISPVETLKRRDIILQTLDRVPTIAARVSLVQNAIISGFDFERHSRLSVGKYWRELTQKEQDEFVLVMRKWTESRTLGKLSNRSDKTTYDQEDTRGRRSLVRTTLWYKGTKTLIDYKMELKLGHWLIYDMVIDGASVALANRDAFYRKISKSSCAELLSTLRMKTLETN